MSKLSFSRLFRLAGSSLCIALAAANATDAANPQRVNLQLTNPRALEVVSIDNPAANFSVGVRVNHPNALYRNGELLIATVTTSQSGYLYLVYVACDGKVACVFPNAVQSENYIMAGSAVTVPSENAGFQLRVTPPFGSEVLKAIVSKTKIDALESLNLAQRKATQLDGVSIKGLQWETTQLPTRDWAEDEIVIATQVHTYGGKAGFVSNESQFPSQVQISVGQKPSPKPQPAPNGQYPSPYVAKTGRRIGFFVGIDRYMDQSVQSLTGAGNDAEQLSFYMRQNGNLDKVIVLLNENATKQEIGRAHV